MTAQLKKRTVTVRYTAASLHHCALYGINEKQRRQLAAILGEDPTCGSQPKRGIKHLRSLPWPVQRPSGKTVVTVWYVFVSGTPHVEVVAITDTDDVGARFNTARALKLVLKIAIAIKAAYSMGKEVVNHWSDIANLFS
jgi:hypothetical protein